MRFRRSDRRIVRSLIILTCSSIGTTCGLQRWSGFRVCLFHTIDDRVISKPQARNRLRPKPSGSRSFGYASEPVPALRDGSRRNDTPLAAALLLVYTSLERQQCLSASRVSGFPITRSPDDPMTRSEDIPLQSAAERRSPAKGIP